MLYLLGMLACLQTTDISALIADLESPEFSERVAASGRMHRLLAEGSPAEQKELMERLIARCLPENAESMTSVVLHRTSHRKLMLLWEIAKVHPSAYRNVCDDLIVLFDNPLLHPRSKIMVLWILTKIHENASDAAPRMRELVAYYEATDDYEADIFYYAYAAGILIAIDQEDEQAIEAIEKLLVDENPQARLLGCHVLAWRESVEDRWIETLTEQLEDENAAVRASAAASLFTLTGEVEPALSVLLDSLEEPARSFLVMPELGIDDDMPGHRESALMTISKMGSDAAEHATELCQYFVTDDERVAFSTQLAILEAAPESQQVIDILEPMLEELPEESRFYAESTIEMIQANIAGDNTPSGDER